MDSRAGRRGTQPQAYCLRGPIAAAFAGHQTAVAVQFALTEGLPAAGLAIIAVALARAVRRSGAAAAARAALLVGAAAALISLLQFVLGEVLAGRRHPAPRTCSTTR